jgi:hypothetical protein
MTALQLGRTVVGFPPHLTQPTELIHHQIDIMIVASGKNEGVQPGLRILKLH